MTVRITIHGPAMNPATWELVAKREMDAASRHAASIVRSAATRLVNRDRGIYSRGWQPPRTESTSARVVSRLLLSNTAPHAATVEHGRRPGARMPPVAVIAAWLLRRGIVANPFVVARNIGRRGIRPVEAVERGVNHSRLRLAQIYEQGVVRIARAQG